MMHLMRITSNEVEFLAGLTFSVLGPVVFERLASRVPFVRPWLLGQSGSRWRATAAVARSP